MTDDLADRPFADGGNGEPPILVCVEPPSHASPVGWTRPVGGTNVRRDVATADQPRRHHPAEPSSAHLHGLDRHQRSMPGRRGPQRPRTPLRAPRDARRAARHRHRRNRRQGPRCRRPAHTSSRSPLTTRRCPGRQRCLPSRVPRGGSGGCRRTSASSRRQHYVFGLFEDFDPRYRYANLFALTKGKDAGDHRPPCPSVT